MFDDIAKEVVDSTLDGYNGTIFAYGQTGSGKTYTISGPPGGYSERGIIPRSLEYIFAETKRRANYRWRVEVSYMEIYNDDGYDLLTDANTRDLDNLPRVEIREKNNEFVLRNLLLHYVEDEEEALLLLNQGERNRQVAETSKNDSSTRSHCVFIIQLERIDEAANNRTRSKLQIVDLSGSES